MVPFTEIETQQSYRKVRGRSIVHQVHTSLEIKKGNEKKAVAQEYQHLWGEV